MTTIEDVFAEFGGAAYYAQLMEYDLVSIWMLDSVTQGISVTGDDLLRFQEDWSGRTMGRLLKPLLKSGLVAPETRAFLEQVRVTRNRLAHSFFLSKDFDLQTDGGRARAIADLRQIERFLAKGSEFFADILSSYLKDFGVDVGAPRSQILEGVDRRAEPKDVDDGLSAHA